MAKPHGQIDSQYKTGNETNKFLCFDIFNFCQHLFYIIIIICMYIYNNYMIKICGIEFFSRKPLVCCLYIGVSPVENIDDWRRFPSILYAVQKLFTS